MFPLSFHPQSRLDNTLYKVFCQETDFIAANLAVATQLRADFLVANYRSTSFVAGSVSVSSVCGSLQTPAVASPIRFSLSFSWHSS
jgi:hypothetical protein